MHKHPLTILLLAAAACTGRGAPAWEAAPLSAPVSIQRPVAPAELLLLVLDAHSNSPVAGANVIMTSTWVQSATDSTGVAVLTRLSSVSHPLRVRRIGYADWHGEVSMRPGVGTVLVVQLRRQRVDLQKVIVGPGASPPSNGMIR